MKLFKVLIVILLIAGFGNDLKSQTNDHTQMNMNLNVPVVKSESFGVLGNCELCKDRIEKSVIAEGATNAMWNQKTKILTVSFDPAKTSADALSKKLAAIGHDTEKFKADDKAYNALPGCCRYERKKE